MPDSLAGARLELSAGAVLGFLLVLARVSSIFAFIPIPGLRSAPVAARVILILAMAAALWQSSPVVAPGAGSGRLLAWLAAEAALGIAVGAAVALLTEAFLLGAQLMGMQAGYSYASTVDPSTEADSGVLLVVAQLASWLMFFALGFDRHLLLALARSLEVHPPGSYHLEGIHVSAVIGLGAAMFGVALRLAMPVIGLLLLVDIAFALLGRINAQLQLLTLAFPAKMLAGIGLFAVLAAVLPHLYEGLAAETLRTVARLSGR
jgi:flagellar biosynthesis protein FliR